MKATPIFFGLMIIISINTFSQKKYDTYTSSWANKTYDISVVSKDDDFSLYINTYTFDDLVGGVIIKQKKLETFIQNLGEAKLKYNEWITTAKANNVKSLDKKIELTTSAPKMDAFYYYGSEWFYNFNAKFEYVFNIFTPKSDTTNTSYYLVVRTGSLQASSNQFIKCKGLAFVFSSAEEIDELIAKLATDKITAFITGPKKEELFK